MYKTSVDLMWLSYTSLLFYFGPGVVAGIVWYWQTRKMDQLKFGFEKPRKSHAFLGFQVRHS